MVYFDIHKDNTPLLGLRTMLHTLLWKFIHIIAWYKVDKTETEFDTDTVVFAAIRGLIVCTEAYAQQIKMQCIHAKP